MFSPEIQQSSKSVVNQNINENLTNPNFNKSSNQNSENQSFVLHKKSNNTTQPNLADSNSVTIMNGNSLSENGTVLTPNSIKFFSK